MLREFKLGAERPLTKPLVDMLGERLMRISIDFGLYGIQMALSVTAFRELLVRRRSRFMPVAIVGLVLSSTATVLANTMFTLNRVTLSPSVEDALGRLDLAAFLTVRFNYLVSDLIVVWRAWVLWRDNRVAQGMLALFMLGALVCTILESIPAVLGTQGLWQLGLPSMQILTAAGYCLLLGTNSVATILIGIKAWQFRRQIQSAIKLVTRKSQVERVFGLLLESGLAYCIIWSVYIVLTVIYVESISSLLLEILDTSFQAISGIYSAAVILASLQSTTVVSQHIASTQVAQAMDRAERSART